MARTSSIAAVLAPEGKQVFGDVRSSDEFADESVGGMRRHALSNGA